MARKPSRPTEEFRDRQWYVAQTQPRKEGLALEHLERQGFSGFLPLVKRARKAFGKTAITSTPLFPSYVFVGFDHERDQWRSINGTIGVTRLISFGEHPAPLPEGFVETLMSRLGEADDCAVEEQLPPGAQVRIIGGIFDDLTGTLLSSKPQERVIVLLDLLSGPRRVDLPRQQLIEA